ncbi:class I SAM-dependent methyltransferase [Streptacidiphilus sp. N1-12]|uniref:Class I SAM-dependent methyltransferase n=2 Tax=Streptacidiphilus alkalitolerans TaxID=3342712 RepID=A0ABV6VAM2_9ACTN
MDEFEQQADRWDQWAPHYDTLGTGRHHERVAARLRDLAPAGPALELGCGTGQVAIELARLGTQVTGLDASPKMVAAFNAKAANLPARAQVGDMTTIGLDQRFTLVFTVASTLFALTSQDDQVACFRAAADHLEPGGVFVVEAGVSDWAPGTRQAMSVREIGQGHASWSAMLHDPVTQTVRSQEIRADADGMRLLPLVTRYAWPAELDLMARVAGLRRSARFGDWEGGSFNADSRRHVTLYTRSTPGDS